MSYTVIRSIHCDRCSNWTDSTDPLATAAQIRRSAKRRGWKVGLPGGVDHCAECAADIACSHGTAAGEDVPA